MLTDLMIVIMGDPFNATSHDGIRFPAEEVQTATTGKSDMKELQDDPRTPFITGAVSALPAGRK